MITGDPMMPATTIGGVLNIARATVDLLDLVGLYFAMEQLGGGKGEIKFMVAGTGWAAAEVSRKSTPGNELQRKFKIPKVEETAVQPYFFMRWFHGSPIFS